LGFDLARPADVAGAIDAIRRTRPAVDLLFNCAGVQPWQLTRTPEGVEIGLATNVLAPLQLMAGLAPAMARAPGSLVLNAGSVVHRWARIDPDDLNHDRRAFDPNAAYYATKLALVLVAQAMARRMAPHGATVWTLEPGMTRTAFARDFRGFTKVMSVLWRPFMRKAADVADEVVALAEGRPAQPGPHLCWSHGKAIAVAGRASDPVLQERVLRACRAMLSAHLPAGGHWLDDADRPA
jgi:NAD(P)-dependent dehydrogenase (short-subunit alcohol dehydrogenase family)